MNVDNDAMTIIPIQSISRASEYHVKNTQIIHHQKLNLKKRCQTIEQRVKHFDSFEKDS